MTTEKFAEIAAGCGRPPWPPGVPRHLLDQATVKLVVVDGKRVFCPDHALSEYRRVMRLWREEQASQASP